MVTSHYAAELAKLAEAAAVLRTFPERWPSTTPPTPVTLFNRDLLTVFRVEVSGPIDGTSEFSVVIFAPPDPVPLALDTLKHDHNLKREIETLVEMAEEECRTRPHRMRLIKLIAELEPAPDLEALRTFCLDAGITNSGPEWTVEECATVEAWLLVPEMREKARKKAAFRVVPDPGDDIDMKSCF